MKTSYRSYIFLLALALNACATPLQPQNYAERISGTRLDDNRFQVEYSGAIDSTDPGVVDLTLLRSAELALLNGFHYFVIVEPDAVATLTDTSLLSAAPGFTLQGGVRYRHASPAASNTIICFRNKPRGEAYVALFVKASLRARYGLDRTGASTRG